MAAGWSVAGNGQMGIPVTSSLAAGLEAAGGITQADVGIMRVLRDDERRLDLSALPEGSCADRTVLQLHFRSSKKSYPARYSGRETGLHSS
jgi:hypothetical protein